MAWAADDNGNAVIYPEVQNIGGRLVDFSDPRNRLGREAAYRSAVERGDTIMMTPSQAEWWTQYYKDYYPGFGYETSNIALPTPRLGFADGGHLYDGNNPDGQKMEVTYMPKLADPKTGMIPEVEIVAEIPEGVRAARRMMARTEPYYDFMNAINLPQNKREWYTKRGKWPHVASKLGLLPMNCINTATYAITQGPTVSSNQHLYDNPGLYDYVRVNPDSVRVGDLVQYADFKDGQVVPHHAGVVTGVPEEKVKVVSSQGNTYMNEEWVHNRTNATGKADTLMYYRWTGKRKN